MKKILCAVSLLSTISAFANEENNIEGISEVECYDNNSCFVDIYNYNDINNKRLKFDFHENEAAIYFSTYYEHNPEEGVFNVCLKYEDKCKIFRIRGKAEKAFSDGFFSNREKRNPVILGAVIREILKQSERVFTTPQGKRIAQYLGLKGDLVLAMAAESNNKN
ncbi:hypothetical protein [Silvanigrella aquatica]|uniref:Uncharacterized protein n=1 Tax=Silvanigrella aquatica TaxID=1915309 RepID=A0A1L4D3B3_9BACT|nr:hypothetical protein [Silvanigrella aquatica]APJ04684.1 hypothetical protein AXG55_12535 [Silvanigrella aquatica]